MFLHGLMGSAANWRRIATAFEDQFQVLAFDQRGHGRSFQPPDGYHPRDYAQDLARILDDLCWQQVALVGHSMGGRNALEFALHFAQRVKCLVIEDIGPEASVEAMLRIERLLEAVPTPFVSRQEMRRFFEEEYPHRIAWYPQPQVVSRFLQANIEQKSDSTQDWRFSKPGILKSLREGRKEDRWDALANLHMPVLIVRGESSRDLERQTFERMKKTLPTAQAVEIPGAGHWVHFDQPEAFIQALKGFFHRVLGTNL